MDTLGRDREPKSCVKELDEVFAECIRFRYRKKGEKRREMTVVLQRFLGLGFQKGGCLCNDLKNYRFQMN